MMGPAKPALTENSAVFLQISKLKNCVMIKYDFT